MKTCLTCNRTYIDETLEFCLSDGSRLVVSNDPEATLQASAKTRRLPKRPMIIGAVAGLLLLSCIGLAVTYKRKAERERAAKDIAQKDYKEAQVALAKAKEEIVSLQKKLDDSTQKAEDDRLNRTVSSRLDFEGGVYIGNGFENTHRYHIDRLKPEATESFTLDLRSGWRYDLISACDENCSDIDLYVYDPNGVLVASDTETDNTPVVPVNVFRGGEFRVKVVMVKCNAKNCVYGIGAFGKK